MRLNAMRYLSAVLLALAAGSALWTTLPAQTPLEASRRLVIRCNADGTYDCADVDCGGKGCCNMP